MRRRTLLTSALPAAAAALALATGAPSASAETVLRFGHEVPVTTAAGQMYQHFADRVSERTGGEVVIEVAPGAQLGSEAEMIEQAKNGIIDIVEASMGGLGILVPALEMSSAPFLWQSWDEFAAVVRGPAFQPLWDELEADHNLIPLTKVWYWGWRNFTTRNVAVHTPADLKGLKMRVPEAPVWVEMIKAVGASPTVIPFNDVYTALQQKVVDGEENPVPVIYGQKFHEVNPYITLDRHMLTSLPIFVNKNSLAKLEPRQQVILFEEAEAASAMNTVLQMRRDTLMLEKMKQREGVQIIEDVDQAAFASAMEPVYDALKDRWGQENLDRVKAAIGEIRAYE
jgi:tripartite ATP-independent transporter DctP family solute receptor